MNWKAHLTVVFGAAIATLLFGLMHPYASSVMTAQDVIEYTAVVFVFFFITGAVGVIDSRYGGQDD